MENTLEKVFINRHLGIKFNSYIDEKCNVWFQAKQVAQILGYKNTVDVIKRHVSESNKIKKVHPRETRGCTFTFYINEAGFYELVFRSKLPAPKMFRQWVFSKVLPSIRKYGYFKMFKSKSKQRVIFKGKKYYKHPVFTNYAARKNGDILSLKSERILKMEKNDGGYLRFKIYNEKLEKRINYSQHRFEYEVFRGPIPRCLEVDHINEIKFDNRIKNLQLLTHNQNVEKGNNKPIISTCIENGEKRRFISIKKAANVLDINADYISKICRKKCKTATSKKDPKKYTFKFID